MVKVPPMSRCFMPKSLLMRKVKRVKSQPDFHLFEPGPEIAKTPSRFQPSMVKSMVKAPPSLRFPMVKRIVKVTPIFHVFQAKILVKTPPVFMVKRSPAILVFMAKVKIGNTSSIEWE